MTTTTITEFVRFRALETTSETQLMERAAALNEFQKKQDGFIDAELVKEMAADAWCLVYHFESMEKTKVIGEKLRGSREFGEFASLLVPGSLGVTMHQQVYTW